MKKLFWFITLFLIFCYVFSINPLAESQVISEGKEYTLITAASTAYPDDGLKLTDGIYGTIPDGSDNYYSSNAYVGFNKTSLDSNGNFVIILDLGKTYGDLKGFTVGYLNETSAGISAPKSIEISISDQRNGDYTELGVLETKMNYTEIASTSAKTLDVPNAVGRYVKITITPDQYDENGQTQTANWTFIDEIAVHSATVGDSESENESQEETSIPEISQTPDTGDNVYKILGYIILGIAGLTMALALFIRTLSYSKKRY